MLSSVVIFALLSFFFGEDLALITQQPDNLIHQITHQPAYQISCKLNIGRGFLKSPYQLCIVSVQSWFHMVNVKSFHLLKLPCIIFYGTPRPAIHWLNLSGLCMTVTCFCSAGQLIIAPKTIGCWGGGGVGGAGFQLLAEIFNCADFPQQDQSNIVLCVQELFISLCTCTPTSCFGIVLCLI